MNLIIYRSFFNVCLVNLYFKKKSVLGGFQGQRYSFKNTKPYLVKIITYYDLENLYLKNILIRFSTKINFKL